LSASWLILSNRFSPKTTKVQEPDGFFNPTNERAYPINESTWPSNGENVIHAEGKPETEAWQQVFAYCVFVFFGDKDFIEKIRKCLTED
jgi:hypothetical protein